MDAIIALFALAVPCGFTLAIVALSFGIGWFVVRRDGRRWAAAARQLGLELEPFTSAHRMGLFGRSAPTIRQKMRGTRGGLPVEVGVRIVVTGSGKNRQTHYYTYARAYLPRRLDMGLHVAPVGFLGRAFQGLVGEGDVQVGHPDLDPRYEIRAAEPDHARALLTIPFLGQALLSLAGAAFPPYLDDTSVKCERSGKHFGAAGLAVALDSAVDLARRVAAAREQTGPSAAERALMEGWRRVAEGRGLSLDLEATRMAGRVEGMHVEADTQLRGRQRWTVFTVRFDRPLGVGLRLARQHGIHSLGKLFGMQDIETGDAIFDGRFVVKGAPEAQVRAMLTPEVRHRLSDLQDRATQLRVEDDHLSAEVGWLVSDPEHVDWALVTVARAGAALAQVSQSGAGPYRR